MSYVLGLDVGTQSTKALLVDAATGAVAGRGSAPHALPTAERDGQAEQEPAMWVAAVRDAVSMALAGRDPSTVAAVGVSGQQHGLVCLDADGSVVRPAKLWCDTESAQEARELSDALGAVLPPAFTASKLLWLKRREPSAFARTAAVLLPHDYINVVATGRRCMERSDASGTGLLDVAANAAAPRWDGAACAAVDARVEAMLPPLVCADDGPIGRVTAAGAAALGLPEGIPVAAGGGDNACAALGVGATPGSGRLIVSLGTSGTVFAPTAAPPARDATGAVAPFCDAAGGWLPLVCVQNCTLPAAEVVSLLGSTHDALAAAAAAEPPGCGGVTFLPFLTGERTPNWPAASGVVAGLRPGSLRGGLLYRAALEGAVLNLAAGYARMRALGLPAASELIVVGGGAASALWLQIVADVFGARVRCAEELEAAALGAALLALAAHRGEAVAACVEAHAPRGGGRAFEPDAAAAAAYAAVLERFQDVGGRLFGGGQGV